MRRKDEEKIIKSRFNPRYKELMVVEGCPRYLKERNLEEIEKGEEIRVLVKLRYGNLENVNKYWLKDDLEMCVFCKKEKDTLEYYYIMDAFFLMTQVDTNIVLCVSLIE